MTNQTIKQAVEEKQQSEEWGAWKFVSEMFDVPHPDKDLADCGIYNTSKCYEQIHDFVVEQKAKARLALLTELRESIQTIDFYGWNEQTQSMIKRKVQEHTNKFIK